MLTQKTKFIILTSLLLSILSAFIGVLSNNAIAISTYRSIHGEHIILFGKGVYALMSILQAATYIGTDLMIIPFAIVMIIILLFQRKSIVSFWILSGGMIFITYYSISMIFGTPLSFMFILYVALFSFSVFGLFNIIKTTMSFNPNQEIGEKKFIKTGIFLIFASISSLIWLSLLIPAIVTKDFTQILDTNTTEPTFAIDIAIIFPIFLFSGISLIKREKKGYILSPILLFFYSLIGLLVIFQTLTHFYFGVEVGLDKLIGLVFSFAFLSSISLILCVQIIVKTKRYYILK